jgi:hypothetical protein
MSGKNAPKHLWIVGVATLLWNAMGAFDYVMTKTQNEGYMEAFTPEQLEFFYSLPAWVTAAWAVAVWGSLVGSALLLMRSKHAVPVFMASLAGVVITTIHNFFLDNGLEVMGTFGVVFGLLILAIAVGLLQYSRKMEAQGVLS